MKGKRKDLEDDLRPEYNIDTSELPIKIKTFLIH